MTSLRRASSSSSSKMIELSVLPVEVRGIIFQKLDPKSLRQLRLVNSSIKEEVEQFVGFNIWIDTDQMTQETFKKLFDMKVHSVRLTSKYSLHQVEGCTTPTEWAITPKYPYFIQILELGATWGYEYRHSTCVQEHLFYKLLKQCPNIKTLSINNIEFLSEYEFGSDTNDNKSWELEHVEKETIIKSMKSLQSLNVKVLSNLEEKSETKSNTLYALSEDILPNISSPVLTSIVIDINVEADSMDVEQLCPNSWYTFMKLISRHWETLSELKMEFELDVGGSSEEDMSWINSDQEISNNLSKVTLSKFSCLGKVDPQNDEARDLMINLVKQQTSLQELRVDTKFLTLENLSSVVEFNANSLRILKVDIRPDSSDDENPLLDMVMVSNCNQLQKIELYGIDEDEEIPEILNLGAIPTHVQELVLRGTFVFPDGMTQLQALSVQCQNLRKLELDLSKLGNIRGLTSVLRDVIQNSEGIQDISISIKRKFKISELFQDDDGWDAWDAEVCSLQALFGCFTSRAVFPRVVVKGDVKLDPCDGGSIFGLGLTGFGTGQKRLADGSPVQKAYLECDFIASNITPEDRDEVFDLDDDDDDDYD